MPGQCGRDRRAGLAAQFSRERNPTCSSSTRAISRRWRADLSVMDRDAYGMRSGCPVVVDHILHTLQAAKSDAASPR
jgi:hypothetical protein